MVGGKLTEKYSRIRYINLTDEKYSPKKFYNLRPKILKPARYISKTYVKYARKNYCKLEFQIFKPGINTYNLRSKTKRKKTYYNKFTVKQSEDERKKRVERYELSGEVQFIKQSKVTPSKIGNWNKNRLPCPKCNIDICKLPGWSCDNVCCRNCLHSFCWQCGESLAAKDFRPCIKTGYYLAKLSRAKAIWKWNPKIHLQNRHGCNICPKSFFTLIGLRTHMRRHYCCSICSRGFATKATLMFHMKEHRNKGLFKCLENPEALRRAILRCVETPEITNCRRRSLRLEKQLLSCEKNGRYWFQQRKNFN